MSFITDYSIVKRSVKGSELTSNEYDNFIQAVNDQLDKLYIIDSVPATATSTGVKNQAAFDADYFYICVATNTWKRIALSTW